MRQITFVLVLLTLVAGGLQAQESCKPGKTGKPAAITGKEAWDLANAAALKWKPDARVTDISTLTTGPMNSEGKATEWNIKFVSEGAQSMNAVSLSKGNISCWSMPGAAGRIIDFDDKIILDTKRLYEIAQKAGGEKFTAKNYTVSASLVENPIHGPLWYYNYEDASHKQGLSVVMDARSGEVTLVN